MFKKSFISSKTNLDHFGRVMTKRFLGIEVTLSLSSFRLLSQEIEIFFEFHIFNSCCLILLASLCLSLFDAIFFPSALLLFMKDNSHNEKSAEGSVCSRQMKVSAHEWGMGQRIKGLGSDRYF